MALTTAEEALIRQLIAQNAALLNLAGSESTILSKLGATKVTLSDIESATGVSLTDLLLARQGTEDVSVTLELLQSGILDGMLAADVGYDNTTSGLDAEEVQGAIDEVADADGITYTPAGTGAVATTVQDKLRESVSVKDFGAVGDGVTDDTLAFKNAVSSGIETGKPFVIYIPVGSYVITDELDFSEAEESFAIIGAGEGKTVLLVTAFGCDKALINYTPTIDVGSGSNATCHATVADLIALPYDPVTGSTSTRDKKQPIFIRFPSLQQIKTYRLRVKYWGNIVFLAGSAFNSDLAFCEYSSNGYQPLYKEVASDTRVTIADDSNVIIANAPIFDAADVNRYIYIQQAPNIVSTATVPGHSSLVAQIISYVSPTEVTIDTNCFYTSDDSHISFDIIRGSITSGSNTLTLDAAVLDQDDVGRIVLIRGARTSQEEALSAAIVSVETATQCTISRPAGNTVTDGVVWTSPTILLGTAADPYDVYEGSGYVSDITLTDMQIENYRGPGVFCDRGAQVTIQQLKTHGVSWGNYNDFAASREGVVVNGVSRVSLSQHEMDFGCWGRDSGAILLLGDRSSITVEQLTMSATQHGGYLFAIVGASFDSQFNVGAIISPVTAWSKMLGVFYADTVSGKNAIVSGCAPLSTSSYNARAVAFPPAFGGQFRSSIPAEISDNTAISLPSWRDQGALILTTSSSTANGLFFYRVSSSPVISSAYSGANTEYTTGVLTGTTGTSGKFTISAANDGKLYFENRLGFDVTVTVALLGG